MLLVVFGEQSSVRLECSLLIEYSLHPRDTYLAAFHTGHCEVFPDTSWQVGGATLVPLREEFSLALRELGS